MQKLAEICVRPPVFATMLILSITVVGLFSFRSLGVDLFPKIDLPTITVTVVNPGASPQEIETEITDKVEGAVNTISGIDELRSTSVEGVSQVFTTFLLEKDPNIAAQEVRNKVDLIVNDLPVTAEQPIVQTSQFNDLVVGNRGSYSVKLSDVGYAEDGSEEPRTEARLNGQPAVTLVVSKQSGQNTVAVADAVKERLFEIQKTLPPGFKTQVVGDQSIFIKASIESIQKHLIQGSILP